MTLKLTPTQILVLAGVMNRPKTNIGILNVDSERDAFAISSAFNAAIERYVSGGLTGLTRTCYESCNVKVKEAIRSLPAFMTGMLYPTQLKLIPDYIDFPVDDVIGGLSKHAESFLTHGQPGFVQIMQSVNVYCATSYRTLALLQQLSDANLAAGDLGHIYSEMSDVITRGVTNQFGPINSKVYVQLCQDLQSFGLMYNTKDLNTCFTYPGLIYQLSRRGFSKNIASALSASGISINEIPTIETKLLQDSLDKISLPILDQMIEGAGMDPASGRRIAKFSDLLDINFILSAKSVGYIQSFDRLVEKITNVLGVKTTLNSWQEIGDLMSQIKSPELNYLEGISSDTSRWRQALTLDTESLIGKGSGPLGNPRIVDVIGSFIGHRYTEIINLIVDIQTKLLLSGDALNLKATLENALRDRLDTNKDALYANGIRVAARQFINPTIPVYKEEINRANKNFDLLFQRFLQEKVNLHNARIDVNTFQGSIDDSLGFVGDLGTITNDPLNLGYSDFILTAASANVHGEAVRASVSEGQNISILQNAGVNIDTILDPDNYVIQLEDQIPGTGDSCCPGTAI